MCVFPKVVRTLWSHAGKYLVLVESGNPQGFALVQEARDIILGIGSHRDDNPTTATTNSKTSRYGKATSHRGKKHPKNKGGGIGGRAMPKVHGNRSGGGGSDAHVLAPCPGDAKCPRVGTSKPCHFPIRVRLKALHAASCVCRVQLAGCLLLAGRTICCALTLTADVSLIFSPSTPLPPFKNKQTIKQIYPIQQYLTSLTLAHFLFGNVTRARAHTRSSPRSSPPSSCRRCTRKACRICRKRHAMASGRKRFLTWCLREVNETTAPPAFC